MEVVLGVILFALLALLVGLVVSMIRIVPEYQRLVVFRLGNCIGQRGPGLILLYPFGIDRAITVDLREEVREVPHQTNITKDNASIGIDFLIYWQVVDAVKSVLEVNNFRQAALGIATTTLRAVIGDIALDDVLAQREHINQVLRAKLDEVTERWGVKVTAVEIREIVPPREIQEAMTRQMSAERTRRAVVTEAQGQREAAITVAEGQKQSAILRAEGEKQSAILQAEGQRTAQVLVAEGFAVALDRVYAVAKTVDAKTLSLQYLEALKAIGASPSTKFIFPMELTTMLGSLAGYTETAFLKQDGAQQAG
ncbi:MAG TPA: SPFH domain-containing protein [Anaerolineae bacterium]|nr:SPFH domain-containing protein [Anaerolineae bacterium]